MKLGRFLAARRLSQDAFAAEIGVTRVSVSHWVHGRRIPYPRHLIAIDRATEGEVSADDFGKDQSSTAGPSEPPR